MTEELSDVPSRSSPSFFMNASGVMAPNSVFQIITHNVVNNLPHPNPSAPPSPLEESHPRIEPESVHGHDTYPRSRLFRLASLLSFYRPDHCLESLQNVRVGNVLDRAVWGETVQKLLKEWKTAMVISTFVEIVVILYSWPSLSAASVRWIWYISTVLSAFTMSLSFVFIQSHRDMIQAPPAYLHNILQNSPDNIKLEYVALMFGTPYGFALQQLAIFLLAFIIDRMAMVDNTLKIPTVLLLIAVGIVVLSWVKFRRANAISQEHPV